MAGIIRKDWFATPVWTAQLADPVSLNAGLLQAARRLREEEPDGVFNTNVNGWQSAADLQTRDDFRPLMEALLAASREAGHDANLDPEARYFIEAWINVSPPGAYNLIHTHPNCHLSGVYYVRTPVQCGGIFFRDPRVQLATAAPPTAGDSPLRFSQLHLRPEEGRLYIFPSWIDHGVEPNRGEEDRVSVAFNVLVSGGSDTAFGGQEG
ncbi:MAG: 2OG-Fe(II) oxygenase family protein [Gammaproteobacteria bacterium]|jgi:uncharacterized protein (TIGR02466 family)|nr:2OG-Fe(II) oxygenase family protein [Gammaproteobacteria bacterium]